MNAPGCCALSLKGGAGTTLLHYNGCRGVLQTAQGMKMCLVCNIFAKPGKRLHRPGECAIISDDKALDG